MILREVKQMTKEILDSKNTLYNKYIDEWTLYELVWQSGKPLIDYAIYKQPRESDVNYKARLRDGYIFNFGKAIIDVYNFYLNEKDVYRDLNGLEKDEQWQLFQKDADLNNTDYDVLLNESQKLASVDGSIGILVNKPGSEFHMTRASEIEAGIYPYYALYSLPNIYDWTWEKNPETHRNELVFLKLKQANGDYLLWSRSEWELWTIDPGTKLPKLKTSGENPLGEIPFVWLVNLKDITHPEIGSSDLVDIARIVTSITQNLSCGEEMIKLAGFPIFRSPMEEDTGFGDDEAGDDEVPIGVRGVEEFNPTYGEGGKPDWMPTQILEPVEAALKWIDRKTDEIYRVAHLSGVHGQRKSNNEVSSGLALRYEFSQLNSVLIAKSTNLTEAELQCLRLWLKWQDQEDMFDGIEIKRSEEFSIDEISIAVSNALTAYKNVLSRTFRQKVMEKIAMQTLPDLTEKERKKIQREIIKNVPKKVDFIDGTNDISKFVRNANQANADHSRDE